MDEKTNPCTIYTLVNQTREEDDDYHSNEEDGEQQWTKHASTKKFINIISTTKITIDGLYQDQPKYHVNMHRIPIIINHVYVIKSKDMVENLGQFSLDEVEKFKNL